jgi:drug/metabolite transporter (DMT)-like permease
MSHAATSTLDRAAAAGRAGGWVPMAGGSVLLGTLGMFVQEAGQDALTTAWCRCVFGALALTAWGAATGRLAELRLSPRDRAAALAAGVLMAANWVLFFAAIERSSIALATVVFHVQPLCLMAAGAWLGERVSRRQVGGAFVSLAGLALASGLVSGAAATAGAVAIGLCAAAAVSYTGVTLIAQRARGVTSYALAWWQCVVGVVVLGAWPIVHGLPAVGPAWAWLAGLGIVHTGLAYVLLYAGMARLSTVRVALLQFVYPATAVIVDAVVYGRILGGVQLAGVAVMGCGLALARNRNNH